MENNVIIEAETFKVSGMYGVEWPIAEIESVELLDELPEVVVKSNGFAAVGQFKGHFRLEKPYGGGLLFVTGHTSPYLYVATDEDYLILNRKGGGETKQIYQTLKIKKIK